MTQGPVAATLTEISIYWSWRTAFKDAALSHRRMLRDRLQPDGHLSARDAFDAALARLEAEKIRANMSDRGKPWTFLLKLDPAWTKLVPHPDEPQGDELESRLEQLRIHGPRFDAFTPTS